VRRNTVRIECIFLFIDTCVDRLIGGNVNVEHIRAHWDEILRLAASIKQGTVTASLMLRKLWQLSAPEWPAVALRELGRIERKLFALDWMQTSNCAAACRLA
jgi:TnpA family transposase